MENEQPWVYVKEEGKAIPSIPPTPKTTYIIIAGGYCHRMKTKGPKSLLEMNGEHLIISQLKEIKRYDPNANVIVTTGLESLKMEKYLSGINLSIVENQIFEVTNPCEELRLALNACTTEEVVVIYGESLVRSGVLDQLTDNCILFNKKSPKDQVGIIAKDGKLSNFDYKSKDKFCGIARFNSRSRKAIQKAMQDKRYKKFLLHEVIGKVSNKIKFDCVLDKTGSKRVVYV